jgi:hypothetical protein
MGVKLFHADGRKDGETDVKKLLVTFRNFLKAPEKWLSESWQTSRVQAAYVTTR